MTDKWKLVPLEPTEEMIEAYFKTGLAQTFYHDAGKFTPPSMTNQKELSLRPARRGYGIVEFQRLTGTHDTTWSFQCKKREQLMEEFKNRFVGFVLGGDLL